MEKDCLDWSRERLWSWAHKWVEEEWFEENDDEIVVWKCKRNKMEQRNWVRDNEYYLIFSFQDSKYIWNVERDLSVGRDEKSRSSLVLFIDKPNLIVLFNFCSKQEPILSTNDLVALYLDPKSLLLEYKTNCDSLILVFRHVFPKSI
jgi:hypothetical protein